MLRVARNDAERNNITFKGLDGVRQYDSKFFKTALDAPLYAVSAGRSLLPQCALDATGFLSDVYKRSTRAKKFLADDVQGGKSMIEMLGVLAIIGVLSVGGIAGYSKAMEKFKINKAMSEYSLLIFGMLEHLDDLRPIACGNASFCGLTSYYQAANLLPGNWTVTDDSHISDSNGNMIFTFVRNKRIGFDLYLGAATGSSKFPQKLCKELFANLVKPLHSSLYHAGIWGTINGGNYLYGDHICKTDGLKCLRDISLSEINNLCESCADNESCCIGIEF